MRPPTNLKKHHCQTRPWIIKRERPWSLNLKEFWVKKKKERKKNTKPISFFLKLPVTLFICFVLLLSSLSPQWFSFSTLSSSSSSISLSLFLFFSSISMLDLRELTTLKATFVVHFLHLLSLSLEIFCLLTYQAPPTWPILVHTLQIYSKSLMFFFFFFHYYFYYEQYYRHNIFTTISQ